MIRCKVITAIFLAAAVSGCATAEKMKAMPEGKIYFSRYSRESTKEKARRELVSRHPEWSEEVKRNVLEGKLVEGMTEIQALSSYGKPLEILQTVNEENKNHALWIYPKTYLIFDDDKLVSIEEVIRLEVIPPAVEKERF